MKEIDRQLQRLLRAAAAARLPADNVPGRVLDPRWLLRQRAQPAAMLIPARVGSVLQGGLAVASLLLLLATFANVRQIQRSHQDVFTASEAVLTRLVTP